MGAAVGECEKRPAAAECSDGAPDRATGDGTGRGRGLAAVLSARQMILDIIGYLLAYRRQCPVAYRLRSWFGGAIPPIECREVTFSHAWCR
jgi:hypothetical protein